MLYVPKDAGSGGGAAWAAAAPLPSDRRGGAEGAPLSWKYDIINMQISLNLRRMKKKMTNLFSQWTELRQKGVLLKNW